jgi:hypothetical protein
MEAIYPSETSTFIPVQGVLSLSVITLLWRRIFGDSTTSKTVSGLIPDLFSDVSTDLTLTAALWPCGPGVDSTSHRNMYQESSCRPEHKANNRHLWADFLENVETSTSHKPMDNHALIGEVSVNFLQVERCRLVRAMVPHDVLDRCRLVRAMVPHDVLDRCRLVRAMVPHGVLDRCRLVRAMVPHDVLDRCRSCFHSRCSSIILMKFRGPCFRPTTSQKIWHRPESNPGLLDL